MRVNMRQQFLLLGLFLLLSCATESIVVRQPKTVTLAKAQTQVNPAFNVSILVFDSGIGTAPAGGSQHKIFPPLRTAEAGYLPSVLKETLLEAGYWGAVRVVPEVDPTAEILVTAKIQISNGIELQLYVRAWDSLGRVWIDREYQDLATIQDYDVEPASRDDPFQDLFNEIANDLNLVRQAQSGKDASDILDTAMLRYAVALSPEAFGEYLEVDKQGVVELAGLPARDDVMYVRATKIRESEYGFIDIVDEQYGNFYNRMRQTYSYWRQYSYELTEYNNRIRQTGSAGRRSRDGSWAALHGVYKTYKDSKMNEDELRELAASFDAEITPTVTRLEGTMVRLTGSLKSQYEEWRELLQEIYASERGQN